MPDAMCQVHHSAMKGSDATSLWKKTEALLSDDAGEMKILLKAGVPLCAHGVMMEN